MLDEIERLPGVTTRDKHQCSEQEERFDQKSKNSVVQQTMSLIEAVEQLREFQDIVCTRYLTDEATLHILEQADPAATSTPADGNRTNEIVATTEPGERRKRKKEEEDEERKRRTKSRDVGIDKKKIKRQKQVNK